MKQCPKCSAEHEKPGTFCSRRCANARIHSPESNVKRALANRGKKRSAQAIEQSRVNSSRAKQEKYRLTPFGELGSSNRRRRVFEDQNQACNRCGLTMWQNVAIPLELEHKDGNHNNNARENLEGLCPNCHALTPTWRGRNPDKRGRFCVH